MRGGPSAAITLLKRDECEGLTTARGVVELCGALCRKPYGMGRHRDAYSGGSS